MLYCGVKETVCLCCVAALLDLLKREVHVIIHKLEARAGW